VARVLPFDVRRQLPQCRLRVVVDSLHRAQGGTGGHNLPRKHVPVAQDDDTWVGVCMV
jgi:hypothetical protein